MQSCFVTCVRAPVGVVVALVLVVHPANTVANKIVAINMINNCFFIVIPSLGGIFSPVRGYSQKYSFVQFEACLHEHVIRGNVCSSRYEVNDVRSSENGTDTEAFK